MIVVEGYYFFGPKCYSDYPDLWWYLILGFILSILKIVLVSCIMLIACIFLPRFFVEEEKRTERAKKN